MSFYSIIFFVARLFAPVCKRRLNAFSQKGKRATKLRWKKSIKIVFLKKGKEIALKALCRKGKRAFDIRDKKDLTRFGLFCYNIDVMKEGGRHTMRRVLSF